MAKQKNTLPKPFIKIGRIGMTIARQAHIKAADIVIDPNHIRHIENDHKTELETLHISALTYVKTIANFFTEIRQRPRNAVLLVLENDDRADDTLTAELTLNEKTHQWEVRTAQPRSDVEKDKLLWRKENGKPAKSLP